MRDLPVAMRGVTEAQDLANQIERLQVAGCDKIFFEKRAGAGRLNRGTAPGQAAG